MSSNVTESGIMGKFSEGKSRHEHSPVTFSSVIKRHERTIDQLTVFSDWSRPWVENLWAYCMSIQPIDSNAIPRNEFNKEMVSMFGMTSISSIERTFDVYCKFSPENKLDPQAMFKGIIRMLSEDLEQKIDYVFDMHDYNFDGIISFDEVSISLKDSLVYEDYETREEGLKEIFELVRKHLNLNADGCINRCEFRSRVRENVLLLEILGPCLPSQAYVKQFMDLISPQRISSLELQQELEKRQESTHEGIASKTNSNLYHPILIVMPSKDDLQRIGRKLAR